MATTYAAHIVTDESLGGPEIIVMTLADPDTGAADEIATYPLGEGADYIRVLAEAGWRVSGSAETTDTGAVAEVEAVDSIVIVEHVTFARSRAEAEFARQDTSWRTVIGNAMRDGDSATALARAAGVSRERVYQLRDGRR